MKGVSVDVIVKSWTLYNKAWWNTDKEGATSELCR